MHKILVTGGAGFVGSHLVEKLLANGYQVVILDDLRSGYVKNLKTVTNNDIFTDISKLNFDFPNTATSIKLNSSLTFYKCGISDRNIVENIFKENNIDFVFHLAAIVSVPYSVAHEKETVEINFEGTKLLTDIARKNNCKGLVHAGSAAEYGDNAPISVAEDFIDDTTKQNSPYGKTKYMAGKYVTSCNSDGFNGVSLRFFNIFGPRQDPTSQYSGVISKFMDCAVKGENLPVCGDGNQTRDFVYVKDVVQAYLYASGLIGTGIPKGYKNEPIFNVATGKKNTINDLAKTIINVSKKNIEIDYVPERPGDIEHSGADVSKIKKVLGFEAKYSLQEGLKETYAFVV